MQNDFLCVGGDELLRPSCSAAGAAADTLTVALQLESAIYRAVSPPRWPVCSLEEGVRRGILIVVLCYDIIIETLHSLWDIVRVVGISHSDLGGSLQVPNEISLN